MDTRKGGQLIALISIEIGYITNPELWEIVEDPGHRVTIKASRQ